MRIIKCDICGVESRKQIIYDSEWTKVEWPSYYNGKPTFYQTEECCPECSLKISNIIRKLKEDYENNNIETP